MQAKVYCYTLIIAEKLPYCFYYGDRSVSLLLPVLQRLSKVNNLDTVSFYARIKETTTHKAGAQGGAPQTDDDRNLGLWVMLLCTSAAIL